MRATNNADEILRATQDWVNEGPLHPRTDDIRDFARGKVLFRIGGNGYSAEVVVATLKDGMMRLYDIVNLTSETIVEKETNTAIAHSPSPDSHRSTVLISKNSIADTAPESKAKMQYIGESAETADKDALARARELDKQGLDNEAIRQQTGWFKGMDGKWQYEIPGNRMEYYRFGDARFRQDHPEYAEYQNLMDKVLTGELTEAEEKRLSELDRTWGNEIGRLSEIVERGNGEQFQRWDNTDGDTAAEANGREQALCGAAQEKCTGLPFAPLPLTAGDPVAMLLTATRNTVRTGITSNNCSFPQHFS